MEKRGSVRETFFLKAKSCVLSPMQDMSYEIAQFCSS